jgi:hypothetical protein
LIASIIVGLSIRAYARQRGVNHVAVLKAVKQGRIALEPDGTVDAAKADASWERSSDPARRSPVADKLRSVSEATVGSDRGARLQNVGNCSGHEPGSAAHWLDRKVPYERVWGQEK